MVNILKKIIAFIIIITISFDCLAAAVSDNDGSAFITKSEFDSLKNDFQAQIDQYNTSIDSKIDTAIAAYLAGIKVSTKTTLKSILTQINSYGYNYSSLAGFPFTNGNIDLSCTTQTPRVNAVGVFCFQNLSCSNTMWVGSHHAGGMRAFQNLKTGAGTAWEFTTLNGYKCLTKFMNVYQILDFSISDAPAWHNTANYGLAHTYSSSIRNRSTNLNTETVDAWTGGFLYRNSSGNYTSTGISSGAAYLTLSKSIYNTNNSAKKGYAAPINAIATSGTGRVGYGYESGTVLGDILTTTDPISGSSSPTDNYQVKFPTDLYYAHHTGDCRFSSAHWPVTSAAYEHLYWYKQFVNTSSFNLTGVYVYPATMAYGSGVRYYNGLPICDSGLSKGTLTFSLVPGTTSDGTKAERLDICFRTQPFDNANCGDSSQTSKNLKNVYYKAHGATEWTKCLAGGGVPSLAPGTTYDFKIENFPQNTTLWVKPYILQNNSSTGTQVWAFLRTSGDIVIESEDG